MAGQGAKGGGQVAMPAAQAMGGSRGPMGPQGTLGGPSIVMPNGMSSGDVNMGGNVSVATGPIDTGLGAEASLVGQRPRITDAMGNPQGSQMFGVAPPIEGTAEAGGVLGGAPALAGITPEAARNGSGMGYNAGMIMGNQGDVRSGSDSRSLLFTQTDPRPPSAQYGGDHILGPQQPAPSYNFTYDQAVGRQQQRDVKSPAEQAAISAAIAAGPSAGSQVGPRIPQIMPDVYKSSDLSITSPQQGSGPILLPSSGPNVTMRPNPNLPNQGLPMPSGGLKGGIFGQQPRPMPQPSQAQYAPLAPQGQFNVNQAAAGALQQAMGATQQGLGFTPMGIRPTAYRPSQIAGTSLAPYTNPYESQVVQQTLRDIGTAQEQALNLQGAQAQRAGAFGGSRQGIAEAETRLGYGQQALDAASRLRQQGYQTALGLAGQDVGAQTAAAQFAAQQQASAQAQNLAAQQAAMGTRLGAAQQLAGLGQQAFGTGQAIQQQQMQQGLLQQMLQQSLIDAAKAQYAGYTGAPSAALAAPLAALGATPSQSTTTQSMQPGLFNYLQLGASMFPR